MKFNSIYERYIPGLNCSEGDIKSSIIFVADSDKLLVKFEEEKIAFPSLNDFNNDLLNNEDMDYLGTIDDCYCFCLPYSTNLVIPEGMAFKSLRTIFDIVDANLSLLTSRAIHIVGWNKRNKYCGVCGNITQKDTLERARRCPSCGNIIYPRISPAIIIAIIKEDRILLAHNKNFKGRLYSVIAGFMEPGESIEDCAEREVFEEVGIKIKNINYFGSQPWPFPDSLMLALTAEYESGEVIPDGVEIEDAGFYSADNLPETPGKSSVAGKLIEWFVENFK